MNSSPLPRLVIITLRKVLKTYWVKRDGNIEQNNLPHQLVRILPSSASFVDLPWLGIRGNDSFLSEAKFEHPS